MMTYPLFEPFAFVTNILLLHVTGDISICLNQLFTALTLSLLCITDDISIVAISPLFGPVAGGTNISVTLRCPHSDCGDVTLYIGDNACLQIYQTQYVW